ncbi:MAG: KPN_02809 family neutral zinc metallopeptidase [Actinomycetes bacterium]
MKFDDQSVDVSGVSDRRGVGGPIAIGGGGVGVVGLLIYLLIAVLGGGNVDPTQLVPQDGQVQGEGSGTGDLESRCNADGAIEAHDDCFLIKVYNEINEVWTDEFARAGESYEQPGLTFFTQAVQTGCGTASSQVGPFYCPPDQSIFIDIGFLEQLQQQFGAEGRYAQAYIMAHESGHHLQTLLGTERRVRAAQQARPSQQNALSVAMELQADCYAGVWSKLADDRGNVSVGETELDQAIGAAEAVGDDRIQQKTQGRVDPESWTHGSAEKRREWFLTGRRTGDVNSCNTFS